MTDFEDRGKKAMNHKSCERQEIQFLLLSHLSSCYVLDIISLLLGRWLANISPQ
jgi:hypothetical protein